MHTYLCEQVGSFSNFEISNGDRRLISNLVCCDVPAWKLADKFVDNLNKLKTADKEARFGNLFVGINKMISNYNALEIKGKERYNSLPWKEGF